MSAALSASSTQHTAILLGVFTSISPSLFTKSSRSSVFMIAVTGVPRTLTLYFSNTPETNSFVPQFSAVWPPKESRMPSGFSFSMTLSTKYGVTGRK